MFAPRYWAVTYWAPTYWPPGIPAGAPPPVIIGAPGLPAVFARRLRSRLPVVPLISLRPRPPLDIWDEEDVLALLALLTGDSVTS